MEEKCEHLLNIKHHQVSPVRKTICEECLKEGDEWVHLRMCITCGYVGCCDNSKNRHASRHFHNHHHPVVVSAQPGEFWAWCYIHKTWSTTL